MVAPWCVDARASPLHPWIVRRVGVHRRATAIDGRRAQLVVPRLVGVDLAQPVRGAARGQPRRGSGGPHVDPVPPHTTRSGARGPPPGPPPLPAPPCGRPAAEPGPLPRG